MKLKVLAVALSVLLGVCLSSLTPAFAAEPPVEEEVAEGGYLPPEVFFERFGGDAYNVQATPYSMSNNAPVTASGANGLKKILLQMFGDYVPIVVQYQYKNNNNSYYTYVVDITPDYIWWASAIIFFLIIFCLFRIGGAILCKR